MLTSKVLKRLIVTIEGPMIMFFVQGFVLITLLSHFQRNFTLIQVPRKK